MLAAFGISMLLLLLMVEDSMRYTMPGAANSDRLHFLKFRSLV